MPAVVAVLVAVPARVRAASRLRAAALLLAVVSCVGALAQPVSAAPPGVVRYALTTAQERVVLRLVDDICGDTWCEGDHAMRFRGFTCRARRGCVLRVQLASWSEEPVRWRTRSARITGFPRFGAMVRTEPDGTRSLQPSFFEAVGRAVRAMTDSVP